MQMPKKYCNNCGFLLETINFTAEMTEQWTWNGDTWECVSHGSLIYALEKPVRCPECNNVVGIGKDFGI